MSKRKTSLVAKQLDMFDFDKTITQYHTKSLEGQNKGPHDNIRTGLPLIHEDKKTISAIATYHDEPERVRSYLEYHLNKPFSQVKTIESKHQILTVYSISGEKTPLLVATLPKDNYKAHYNYHVKQGKNEQLKSIYALLKKKGYINSKTDIHYFDDDKDNIQKAVESLTQFPLTVHHIDGGSVKPTFDTLSEEKNQAFSKKNRHRFHKTPKNPEENQTYCGCFSRRLC